MFCSILYFSNLMLRLNTFHAAKTIPLLDEGSLAALQLYLAAQTQKHMELMTGITCQLHGDITSFRTVGMTSVMYCKLKKCGCKTALRLQPVRQ